MIQYGVQYLSTVSGKQNPTLMQICIRLFQKIPKLQREPVAELVLLNVCLVQKEWKSRSIANNILSHLAVKEVNIFIFVSSY